jgi:hypothetical protein
VETRYWGILLVKSSIICGGEGVSHAVTWTKLLLSILNVPCPGSWRRLIVETGGKCVIREVY